MTKPLNFFVLTTFLVIFSSVVLAQEVSLNLLNQGHYNIQKELLFKRITNEGKLAEKEENDLMLLIKNDPRVAWNSYDKISFASFDLDQDSKKEVFAYYGKGMSCKAGCGILAIYKDNGDVWKSIGLFSGVEGEVAVLKSSNAGFYDVAFSSRLIKEISADFEWSSDRAEWNGEIYKINRSTFGFRYDNETQWPLQGKDTGNLKFSGDQIYKTFYQKEFFTTLFRVDHEMNEYMIGVVGETGFLNQHQKILDDGFVSGVGASYKYTDKLVNKWFVAVPFSVKYKDGKGFSKSGVGIAIIDDSGKRVKSQIIESGDEMHLVSDAGFLTESDQEQFSFAYAVDSEGKKKKFVQKISVSSLRKIGDRREYGDKDLYLSMPGRGNLFFPSSEIVAVVGGSEYTKMSSPRLRNMRPDEIMPNYELGEGEQASRPKYKICAVTFKERHDTHFTVLANPNSTLSIRGFSSKKKSKISIPVDSFDKLTFYRVAYNQYSYNDLLYGKFKPFPDLQLTKERAENEDKKRIAELKKRIKDCEVRKKARDDQAKENTSFADAEDDLGCETEEYDDEVALNCELKSPEFNGNLVVMLPNNQMLIFDGDIDPISVVKSPSAFFTLQKH